MTGPEHYAASETFMRGAERYAEMSETSDPIVKADAIASVTTALLGAQVHATLALAAATAALIPDDAIGNGDIIRAWGSAGAR